MARRCSRPGCKQDAVYTLTYVYRDSTAVVGPLAAYTEPHCYDLCEGHAGRLTAPLGWDVVRLPVQAAPAGGATEPVGQGVEVGRRGHLRVLRSSPNEPGRR
jgi:hypothetical protein